MVLYLLGFICFQMLYSLTPFSDKEQVLAQSFWCIGQLSHISNMYKCWIYYAVFKNLYCCVTGIDFCVPIGITKACL